MEPRAYNVLREMTGRITHSNVDPAWLGDELLAAGIIGGADFMKTRNSALPEDDRLEELVRKVTRNGAPDTFQTFVSILLRKAHVQWLGEELKSRFVELGGVWNKKPTLSLQSGLPLVHIRGAEIIAKTTLEVVPGTSLLFYWKGHGLRVHIPADALPLGTPPQTMIIQASLNGDYQFPLDTELVSAIYWVTFPWKLSRPITLELQHCAYLEQPDQLSSLSFLTARCNQKTLPYSFQALSGGMFSGNTSYGAIVLSHFSAFGIGMIRDRKKEKCYTAQVFYISQAPTTWLIHFTIYCDLEIYCEAVKKFYSEKNGEPGPYLDVTFDGDEVSLEIPDEKNPLPSGWSIELLVPPRLLRKSVKKYTPGRTVHSCQFELIWKEHAERLSHKLKINGLKCTESFITLTRNPILPAGEEGGPGFEDPSRKDFSQFGAPTLQLLMNLVGSEVRTKWRQIGRGLCVDKKSLTASKQKRLARQKHFNIVWNVCSPCGSLQ